MRQEVSLPRQRRHLHFDALVQLARQRFATIPDSRRQPDFSLPATLMAGLALFSLKDPSLLAFQRRTLDHNLRSVFGLHGIPSDSQMRVILDDVAPDHIRPFFNDILRELHKAKVLQLFRFEDCYLVALDGVEYFCSKNVHGPHRMTRHHANGNVSYYHQLLGAAIVHPDFSEVIPLAPEPIQRNDGQTKNDCERNAARRWLKRFRQDHPRLPVIVIEDALSSNAPHIRDLTEAKCHFLLGVKEADHVHLFEQIRQRQETDQYEAIVDDEAGTEIIRCYLFAEGLSLNESNAEVKVNILQLLEIHADQTEHRWSWVTDLVLSESNVRQLARGRSSTLADRERDVQHVEEPGLSL